MFPLVLRGPEGRLEGWRAMWSDFFGSLPAVGCCRLRGIDLGLNKMAEVHRTGGPFRRSHRHVESDATDCVLDAGNFGLSRELGLGYRAGAPEPQEFNEGIGASLETAGSGA